MIHHIDFAVTDLVRSRELYERTLAPLGLAVEAFHAAALQAGGKDKGPPGLRPRYGEHWYAAFVLDPDGHNIEAVCRGAT
jgi:catechol 2,3-dioxygenase-like lactoylglutathione lyase family enzyme